MSGEPTLGLEQVAVADRDLRRGQVRVGGRQQVLAVEAFLSGDLGLVDPQLAGRGLSHELAQGLVVAQRAFSGDVPGQLCLQPGLGLGAAGGLQRGGGLGAGDVDAIELGADPDDRIVAGGLGGVQADHPPDAGVDSSLASLTCRCSVTAVNRP